MSKTFIIAIDGGVASGKSSLAGRLAVRFGFDHLNTGLLYRVVGYAADQNNVPLGDEAAVTALARHLAKEGLDKHMDNPALLLETTGQVASIVAQYQGVRGALLDYQRNYPNGRKGVVIEGRDITTKIFPFAEAKIYVTASPEIRAQRRLKELQKRDASVTYGATLADVHARDARDAWNIATIAPDAFVLDNSTMGPDETEAAAAAYIQERMKEHSFQPE